MATRDDEIKEFNFVAVVIKEADVNLKLVAKVDDPDCKARPNLSAGNSKFYRCASAVNKIFKRNRTHAVVPFACHSLFKDEKVQKAIPVIQLLLLRDSFLRRI